MPSTRVPPTNTTRAIRVPLLAVFPISMLLPVSASIRTDREASQEESRFLWFGGWSQESVRRWHPRFSCSSTNGQVKKKKSRQEMSSRHPFSNNSSQMKWNPKYWLFCLSPWPDKTNSGCFILVLSPSKVPLYRPFGRLFSQAFRVYMFYYVAEQMF